MLDKHGIFFEKSEVWIVSEKLSLKAMPLANGMVKAKTGNTTDATTYADWYKSVYMPAADNTDAATQSAAKAAKAAKEWLAEFSTFSIYQVLPKIIELRGLNVKADVESKKLHATDRPMTTPLFLLRCVQLGISICDLDLLTIGMVNEMYAESSNDEYKGYAQIAT